MNFLNSNIKVINKIFHPSIHIIFHMIPLVKGVIYINEDMFSVKYFYTVAELGGKSKHVYPSYLLWK